jgi:multicomponent Na+:H+ antiporter subunit F
MTPWLLSLVCWLPPLLLVLWFTLRGPLVQRLIALQLATNVTILLLAAMSFAFDQTMMIDLPLTLAALSLPGTLMLTLFVERWL